ncbi:hypothetical protein CKY28_11300 [Sphingomonas lenta]|uniref:Uncharacterized protein n=1 Tax=Sphingomonas lenta TaxID=1141887 RepID=A0A2A2SGG2_9SPHN|nr:hypothetical protein CKY28_11300 [Sphingomonas lenta]
MLAGCAGSSAAPDGLAAADRIPAATSAGEPEQCIPIRSIRESRVRSDQVIDFVTTGRRTYRVTLPQRCPGLGFEQRFTYATSLDRLCAQDIITVLYQGGAPQRGASCGLAPFQPVTLATRR